jgi:hypothetical protein
VPSIVEAFGSTNATSRATVVARSWSPFAPVNVKVPTDVVVARSTTSVDTAVNRPRCVAVPSSVAVIDSIVGTHGGRQLTVPTVLIENDPRKGNDAP